MNDLLIYALIIAGGYYLFTLPVKSTNSQSTQTEPLIKDELVLESQLEQLIRSLRELNYQLQTYELKK